MAQAEPMRYKETWLELLAGGGGGLGVGRGRDDLVSDWTEL